MVMIYFTLIKADDLAFINEVRNECAEYLHDPRTFTLEETQQWFKGEPKFWIIWNDGERIGYFRTSNYTGKTAYVGADLHKDFRGKGFGYIAYRKFLPYFQNLYDLDAILLEVLETNDRAKYLYNKLGFKEVSRKQIERNGEMVNSILMKWTTR
jgi:RimJ/RimL family protein N-acetyltransferase